MKKLRLLLFASLVATGASAQYFQHVYGGPTRDFLESGVNTNPLVVPATTRGHIMAGYTDRPGINTLMVTRTDFNGNPAPFFNFNYPIRENLTTPPVNAKGRRVIQPTQMGGRICVWGDFATPPGTVSTKFFYTLLNPNGTPIAAATASYVMPATFPVVEAEATSMVFSTTAPDSLYVCGFVRQTTAGPRFPFVMSINPNNGNIQWAWIYQINNIDWYPMDMVVSPYPTTGGPALALTGHFIRPGVPEHGFFWLLNKQNGNPPSITIVEYGIATATNPGALNAIDVANNPFGQGPGFVLGGYYNNPATGNNDCWALKINPNGLGIDFSTLIDYRIPGNNEIGNDIIERRNTLGAFEYYLGGEVVNGVFGGQDALVHKLDFTGVPVPGGQFTYGGPGNDRALQLDQANGFGVHNDGLSTYGTTNGSFPLLGNSDFYLVKSYFNGVTKCNYDLQTPPWVSGPKVIEKWQATIVNRPIRRNLTIDTASMQHWEICWADTIPAGNNSRLAAAAQQITQPGYFPNPVSRDNAVVTVMFGNQVTEGEAEIELWNSLGQLCWTRKAALTNGQTNMQVELGNELSGGMYHLVVRQNGAVNNYRILVQ